jgi:dienelactone hydrolase
MGGRTMTELLLFNHALGVTEGVKTFADQIRAAGHTVTVGDLFDGKTFSTIEEGVAYEEGIGFEAMIGRSEQAAGRLPASAVFGGFSLGAVYAQRLAQTRPGALGALLYHAGDIPPTEFSDSWPENVALQIHVSEGDKWVDREGAERVAAEAKDGELFVYPGSGHLFTDRSSEEFDEDSATLVLERTIAFLERAG